MFDWTALATIFAAFFVVAAAPGPATLAVSTVAAAKGRRHGVRIGAGLALGLAFWGLVAATGLGAVLQTTTSLLTVLKFAGGLYLLWLAYASTRSAFRPGPATAALGNADHEAGGKWFLRGLFLNLSNPKAVVAWMAALSVGLGSEDGVWSVAVATVGCAGIGFAIYGAYAYAFSVTAVRVGYARFRRWIDGVVAALFAVAGLGLLRSALTRV